MALDGDAIARHDSYVLFIPGAIPGEEVDAEVVATGRKFGRARIISILKPSPHRVAPPCPHFGPCGGCTWQHIAYDEQLRLKERILANVLGLALGTPVAISPTEGLDPPWAFRNKAHFVVGPDASGAATLGHFGAHSKEFIPVGECPVHSARGNQVAFRLRDILRSQGVPPVQNDRPGTGTARHVVVRASESGREAQTILVATKRKFQGLEDITREITSGDPAASGFHLSIHRREGYLILGSFTRRLAGRERLLEEVAGVRFLISAVSFFQTNVRAAGKLAAIVTAAVSGGSGPGILDLYAGVGLFSLPLARLGHRVTAVEENPSAVEDGIETARLNHIKGVRFITARVEDVLRGLARRGQFRAVLLDPPREGTTERVLRTVAGMLRPHRIIYVSCDPRALARDLKILTSMGYAIDAVRPVDMFPHTAHIEAVAVLTLARPERHEPTADTPEPRRAGNRPEPRRRPDREGSRERGAPPHSRGSHGDRGRGSDRHRRKQ